MDDHDGSPKKGACKEAIKAVLEKLSNICTTQCSEDIMSDYFCTTVSALSGASCQNGDVLIYYATQGSTSCSVFYQQFMPEVCTGMGLSATSLYQDFSGSIAGFTDNYYGGCYTACSSGRRLNHEGTSCRRLNHDDESSIMDNSDYVSQVMDDVSGRMLLHDGTGYSGTSTCSCGRRLMDNSDDVSGRMLKHDGTDSTSDSSTCGRRRLSQPEELEHFKGERRSLSHVGDLSYFESSDAMDNLITVDPQFNQGGVTLELMDYKNLVGSVNDLDYYTEGKSMVTAAQTALATNNGNRRSILSGGFSDMLNSADENIICFVARFLHKTANVWVDSSVLPNSVPMFPSCDPEFEESITRDNIEIKNLNGVQWDPGADEGRRLQLDDKPCVLGPSLVASAAARTAAARGFATHNAIRFW